MKPIATGILIVVTMVFLFCVNPAFAEESGDFSGSWVANGSSNILELGKERSVALFSLVGHVNLKNDLGNSRDYWAKCVGLSDTESGGDFRCVWSHRDGSEIYLLLRAETVGEGQQVKGQIIGGSGAVAGISGELSFSWNTFMLQGVHKGAVGGYSKNLKGSYRLP